MAGFTYPSADSGREIWERFLGELQDVDDIDAEELEEARRLARRQIKRIADAEKRGDAGR
ncbi:MAG: hypothetical protein ACREEE_15045 [Dongiaceae bacterium]